MIPCVFFHVSYSFHKWFLYHRGDFQPAYLDNLREKVCQFEKFWNTHEPTILTLISQYTGLQWPYTEIHVYCFENAQYYPVPCISDPVSINMTGEPQSLHVLYLIHELVHVITQFDDQGSSLSLDAQEAIAYFVGNRVLEDIVGKDAHPVIRMFTISWPYDFPKMVEQFKEKMNIDEYTIVDLIEKGVFNQRE
jgi:hypothetical protein